MNEMDAHQGWQARLALEYGPVGLRTRLLRKQQHGPLTVQRAFYPEGDICHNYILHPPGGVVGGDTLEISARCQAGAHCLLTTPGAAKFYRAAGVRTGRQSVRINVAGDAVVEWLPQPNIFFCGAQMVLDSNIDVAATGKFVGWEIHCFGRPAAHEYFTSGAVRSETRVSVDGELRLLERLDTCGDGNLLAATGLRGNAMQGCLIAAPCSEQQRDILERILQSESGVDYPHPLGLTLVDEVLIVRALGQQAEPLQQVFTRLWLGLREHWLARAPCLPRIWAT
jgi:urease accessory protein